MKTIEIYGSFHSTGAMHISFQKQGCSKDFKSQKQDNKFNAITNTHIEYFAIFINKYIYITNFVMLHYYRINLNDKKMMFNICNYLNITKLLSNVGLNRIDILSKGLHIYIYAKAIMLLVRQSIK